jgi:hypothetical protein
MLKDRTGKVEAHQLLGPTRQVPHPLDINLHQILADDDASGEVAGDLLGKNLQHALIAARTMMGEHEGLGIGAESDLSDGIAVANACWASRRKCSFSISALAM